VGTHSKIRGISTYLSMTTLNVNTFKSPINRCRLGDVIKKQDPTLYGCKKGNSLTRNTQTESQIICQANGIQKPTGVAILLCDKIDARPKLVRREKRKKVHTTQGNSPSRRYSDCKYI
jgi:hypothetical protein